MKDANNIIIGFTWQFYANHKSSAIARNMKLGNVQTEAPTTHGDRDTEGLQAVILPKNITGTNIALDHPP